MIEKLFTPEVAPERKEEVEDFVLGLFVSEIEKHKEQMKALEGQEGQRMSAAARESQFVGCRENIELLNDAIKLYDLERLK